MLFSRPDGTRMRGLDPARRLMPMLMRTRNESLVFYEQIVDATALTAYIDRWNERAGDGGGARLTPLHLVIASLGRVLKARPQLDRFVAARRLWQRKETSISFAAKKEFVDRAPLKTVKLAVVEGEALGDTLGRIRDAVEGSRTSDERPVDKELSLLDRLPTFALSPLVRTVRVLDSWNLLPNAFIENDPLYASAFVANLGSVGIDRAWHHLYEYGTVSLFCVIGALRERLVAGPDGQPVVKPTLRLRFTLDERICDGWYAAQSLEILRADLEDPERFAAPPPAPSGRAQNALRSTL